MSKTATLHTTSHAASSPSSGLLLQRACACSGAAGLSGECEECKTKKFLGKPLQTKLAVSQPGDEFEQEADRVADQVMAVPSHSVLGGASHRIQRYTGQIDREMGTVPTSVDHVLASSGRPLDPALQKGMRRRFGYDFSHVRIHTGAEAEQSAREVNAHAYTVGHNIVFGAGRYAPGSNNGLRLIAHELAHVVQQDTACAPNGRAGIAIDGVDDPLEREAETAAQRTNKNIEPSIASASLSAGVGRVARAPVLQRDDGLGEKKEEIPIPRVPYREKAPMGETEPEQGAVKGPTLTLANAARPTCDPKGFLRKDYLAQPNTSNDEFGLTRFAGTVSMALTTRKVKGGVMLEPLKVALPAITSVFTKADTFIEGTGVVLSQEGAECPGGKVPLQWRILSSGAVKIQEGEIEHCEDLQHAYDVTFGWYAQVVDGLIAKGRTFLSEAAAFKHLQKLTGTAPANWPSVFECLAKKTENRDGRKFTNAWHTPRVKALPPRLDDSCKFSRVLVIGAANFPELGKHPAPDVIKGCGESSDAVKALAAKASAGGEGGGGYQKDKPGEPTPKMPEPPPKSMEPGR